MKKEDKYLYYLGIFRNQQYQLQLMEQYQIDYLQKMLYFPFYLNENDQRNQLKQRKQQIERKERKKRKTYEGKKEKKKYTRWNVEEKHQFLKSLKFFDCRPTKIIPSKKISMFMKTRNQIQVRSYAQKFFEKLLCIPDENIPFIVSCQYKLKELISKEYKEITDDDEKEYELNKKLTILYQLIILTEDELEELRIIKRNKKILSQQK